MRTSDVVRRTSCAVLMAWTLNLPTRGLSEAVDALSFGDAGKLKPPKPLSFSENPAAASVPQRWSVTFRSSPSPELNRSNNPFSARSPWREEPLGMPAVQNAPLRTRSSWQPLSPLIDPSEFSRSLPTTFVDEAELEKPLPATNFQLRLHHFSTSDHPSSESAAPGSEGVPGPRGTSTPMFPNTVGDLMPHWRAVNESSSPTPGHQGRSGTHLDTVMDSAGVPKDDLTTWDVANEQRRGRHHDQFPLGEPPSRDGRLPTHGGLWKHGNICFYEQTPDGEELSSRTENAFDERQMAIEKSSVSDLSTVFKGIPQRAWTLGTSNLLANTLSPPNPHSGHNPVKQSATRTRSTTLSAQLAECKQNAKDELYPACMDRGKIFSAIGAGALADKGLSRGRSVTGGGIIYQAYKAACEFQRKQDIKHCERKAECIASGSDKDDCPGRWSNWLRGGSFADPWPR